MFIKESTTGESLENLAWKVIKDLDLSAENFLVAQSYDGASNMSRMIKGVAARIRQKYQEQCNNFNGLKYGLEFL